MKTLSELKDEIREESSSNPEKFFAVKVLKEKGFERSRCENCSRYFWSYSDREVCGEPECSGGYTFIGDSPTSESFSYIESWELFREFMSGRGYTPIDRYPVIARWRNDTEFVGGSIYNFQPHVVSGEAEPPAEELIVPQPSLRFNDIDNVGITGRHYVLHDHIGQTCFKRKGYDQDRYFRDMFEFSVQKLGIPKSELILHEDAWGGGGNLGACMEFFVDGLELFNQVYMFYRQTPEGYEELDLKVLDMGMGHERITWISHGSETSYEVVMPEVLEEMKQRTGLEQDSEIWEKFLPYSGMLNADEVDDLDEKWEEIASEIGMDTEELRSEIRPLGDLYAVAEHSRSLLFALADGKLPSNTGGGHNLRAIYRRSRNLIKRHGWDLDVAEICEWHAKELEPMFPELEKSMEEVEEILQVESEKYEKSREKAKEELASIENPSIEKMIELYESQGVSPEMMEDAGFDVPEDFYSLINDDEESVTGEEERFHYNTEEETEKVYYKDENQRKFGAEVVERVQGGWVILDRTVFYPEGGGQAEDTGILRVDGETYEVEDVQKQSGVILHKVPGNDLKSGEKVECEINWSRRKQLMQHHTSTHMVNFAVRKLYGDHIWQAGAKKTIEKARLDVTHYEKFDTDALDRIEDKVLQIIEKDYPVDKETLKKSEAEKEYGFRLYQGGAAPGGEVRVVSIDDVDHEACGGTHLSETAQAEEFVVTDTKRIQDGVVRLEYKAGDAAEKHLETIEKRINEAENALNTLETKGRTSGRGARELQRKLCEILSVDPENLVKSIKRFRNENREMQEKIRELSDFYDEEVEPDEIESGGLEEMVESLFKTWKENEKKVENLEGNLGHHVRENIEERRFEGKIPTENVGLLIQVAREVAKGFSASVTLIGKKGAVSASYHEEFDANENLEKYAKKESIQGDENFAKVFELSDS